MNKKKDFITKLNIKASRGTWAKYFNKIRDLFCVSKVDFLIFDLLTWQQPKLPRMRKIVQFEFGDIDDIHEINVNPHLEAQDEADYYIALFKAGNKIVVGRFAGKIVCYTWIVFKRKSTYNKFFKLKQNEFMFMRSFVQKEYRGFGLLPYSFVYIFKEFKPEGYEVCFADIDSHNIVSQRSVYKLGAESTKSGYYLINFLWKQFVFPFGKFCNRFVRKKIKTERI